jgi:hypothetical protein
MSVSAVRNKIVEKLNAMSSLNAVYDYPASNEQGKYPYATVTLRRSDAEIRSTAHNLRTHSFWVRVYQEMSKVGQGVESAERIVVNVIDELEKAFDMDTTLSGTVHWCEPVSWNGSYRNREHDTRILEVQIDAKELVTAR